MSFPELHHEDLRLRTAWARLRGYIESLVATVTQGHLIQGGGAPAPQQPTLNFTGSAAVTNDAPNTRTNVNIIDTPPHVIQGGGAPAPQQPALNFVGPAVADDVPNNRTNVTFTDTLPHAIQGNGAPTPQQPTLNFIGPVVTDDAPGNKADVTFTDTLPHVIQQTGTPMPQQAALNFVGPVVVNDAVNNRTNVYQSPEVGAMFSDPGRPYICKAEGPVVAAGATYTMIDMDGEGYMTQFFMSVHCDTASGRQDSTVKIYVDGEVSPSIDVKLVDLGCARGVESAGGVGAASAMFVSRYVGYTSLAFSHGVSYYLFIDVPFRTHLKLTITNADGVNAITLGGYIQYYLKTGIQWGRYGKLHGVSFGPLSVVKYVEQTLVDIAGAGLMHGMYLHMHGGDANYNYLEGNPKVYIDSEVASSCEYDSTEDYFLFSWYFWAATATRNVCTDFIGVTRKDDSDQVGAYRWHIRDPLAFDTHLKVTWSNGEIVAFPVVNNTVINGVVWYYTTA